MNNYDFSPPTDKVTSSVSLRDLLAVGFRRKRIATLCFSGVLLGAFLFAFVMPTQYRATTKFLLERQREEATVTPEKDKAGAVAATISEEELNSEVGLLQDADVLRKVVLTCGLYNHKSLGEYIFGPAKPEKKIAKAVNGLAGSLKIEPEKKSNLIDVSYTSADPQLTVRVLQTLADAYIAKYKELHTPPGQYLFFAQETEHYAKNLADAEAQLKDFSNEENGVAPTVTRDLFLQKLAEFHLNLQTTRAQLAATEMRIHTLEKQAGMTPERMTTALREEDDAPVLQGLKNTLMTLENKRTELLTKYQPEYPLVQEVDKEITDTKASIATEEAKPIKQQTTDRNPTYAWVDEELAKAKADYAGLKAQESAMQTIVTRYEQQSRDLAQKGLVEQNLERNYKADEESYLLYLRKREEARMAEALDSTRIVNVAVAENPVVPTLPVYPPLLVMVLGTLVAATVAAGAVYIQEHLDPAFHTPADVASELDIPLLAAVPRKVDSFEPSASYGNGNGHGRIPEFAHSESASSIDPLARSQND